MARPRKSRALKVIEGNRSRRSLDYSEPEPNGMPEMPDDLDGDAAICWMQHIDQLVINGAGRGDSLRIAGMCRWYSRYIRLERMIDENPTPDYRQVIMAGMAWKHYSAAASAFGISPTDRARLRTDPPKKKESKWLGLMA